MAKYVTSFIVFVAAYMSEILLVESQSNSDIGFWANILNFRQDSTHPGYTDSFNDNDYDASDIIDYDNSDEDSTDSSMRMHNRYFRQRNIYNLRRRSRKRLLIEGMRRRNRLRNKLMKQYSRFSRQNRQFKTANKNRLKMNGDRRRQLLQKRNRKPVRRFDDSDSVENTQSRLNFKGRAMRLNKPRNPAGNPEYRMRDFNEYRKSNIRNRLVFPSRRGIDFSTARTTAASEEESNEQTSMSAISTTEALSQEESREQTSLGTFSTMSTTGASQEESQEQTSVGGYSTLSTTQQSQEIDDDLLTTTPQAQPTQTPFDGILQGFDLDAVGNPGLVSTTQKMTTTESEREVEREVEGPGAFGQIRDERYGGRFVNKTGSGSLRNLTSGVKRTRENLTALVEAVKKEGGLDGKTELTNIVSSVENSKGNGLRSMNHISTDSKSKKNQGNVGGNDLAVVGAAVIPSARGTSNTFQMPKPEHRKTNGANDDLSRKISNSRSSGTTTVVDVQKTNSAQNKSQLTNIVKSVFDDPNFKINQSPLTDIVHAVSAEKAPKNFNDSQFAKDMEIHNSEIVSNRKMDKEYLHVNKETSLGRAPSVNVKPTPSTSSSFSSNQDSLKISKKGGAANQKTKQPIDEKGGKSVGITSLVRDTIVLDNKGHGKINGNGKHITFAEVLPVTQPKETGGMDQTYTFEVVKPRSETPENNINLANQFSEERIGFELKELPLPVMNPRIAAPDPIGLDNNSKQTQEVPRKTQSVSNTPKTTEMQPSSSLSQAQTDAQEKSKTLSIDKTSGKQGSTEIKNIGKALPLMAKKDISKGGSTLDKDNSFHLSNKYGNEYLGLNRKELQAFDDLYKERAPAVQKGSISPSAPNTNNVPDNENQSLKMESKPNDPIDKSSSISKNKQENMLNSGKGKSRGITQNVIRKSDIGPRLQEILPVRKDLDSDVKSENSLQNSKLQNIGKSKSDLKKTVMPPNKEVLSLRGPLSAPMKTILKKQQRTPSDGSLLNSNLIEKSQKSLQRTEKYPSKAKMISEGYPDDSSNGKHRSFVKLSDSQEVKGGFVNPKPSTDSKKQSVPVRVMNELGVAQMANSHQRGFSSKEKRSGKHMNFRKNTNMPQGKINYTPIKGNDASRPNKNSRTMSVDQISPREIWSSKEKNSGNGNTIKKEALYIDKSTERRHRLNLSRGRHIRLNGREMGQHSKIGIGKKTKDNDIISHKNNENKHPNVISKTNVPNSEEINRFVEGRNSQLLDSNMQAKIAYRNSKRIEASDAMNKKLALLVNKTLGGANQNSKLALLVNKTLEGANQNSKLAVLVNKTLEGANQNSKGGFRFSENGRKSGIPSSEVNMIESKRHRIKGLRRGHGKTIDKIIEERVKNTYIQEKRNDGTDGKLMKHAFKNELNQREVVRASGSSHIRGQEQKFKMYNMQRHTKDKGSSSSSSIIKKDSNSLGKRVGYKKQSSNLPKNENQHVRKSHNKLNTVLVIENKEYKIPSSNEIYKGRGAIRPNDIRRKSHSRSSRKKKGIKPIRVSVSSVRRKKMNKGQTKEEKQVINNPAINTPVSSEFVHSNDNDIRKTALPSNNTIISSSSKDYELVGKWNNGKFVDSLKAGDISRSNRPNVDEMKTMEHSGTGNYRGLQSDGMRMDTNEIHTSGRNGAGDTMEMGSGRKAPGPGLTVNNGKSNDVNGESNVVNGDNSKNDNNILQDNLLNQTNIDKDTKSNNGGIKGGTRPASNTGNDAIANIANTEAESVPQADRSFASETSSSNQVSRQINPSVNNVRTKFVSNLDKKATSPNINGEIAQTKNKEIEIEKEIGRVSENETETGKGQTTNSPSQTNSLPSSDGSENLDDIQDDMENDTMNQSGQQYPDYSDYLSFDDDNISSPPPIDSVDYDDADAIVDSSWGEENHQSGDEDYHVNPIHAYSDSNDDSSEEFVPREDSYEDSRGGYSGEGYNLYNGPWIQSAQEHAKERAEEMEGEWKDVNITRVGNPSSSTCPKYRVRYQDNAVVLDTLENSCRVIITWNKRQKREERKEKTWWGTRVYYKSRTVYVPVVTYVDLR